MEAELRSLFSAAKRLLAAAQARLAAAASEGSGGLAGVADCAGGVSTLASDTFG